MTAAGKSQSQRDLVDWQFWLIDQQVTRHVQPSLHDVGMRRRSRTLAEGAFEVTSADPGKRSQLAQLYRLTERILDVLENELKAGNYGDSAFNSITVTVHLIRPKQEMRPI
jgi:hypothetical protein